MTYHVKNLSPRVMPWLVLLGVLLSPSGVGAVTYDLTFSGTWNSTDITGAFPGNAHFTTLIGVTHTSGTPLWSPGQLASPGVERVAEEGIIGDLGAEIAAAISGGTVATTIQSMEFFGFPNSSSTSFEAFASHPSVTVLSKVAPSPDWFVGVSNLPLRNANGWIEEITVDLRPWDAGTEDGALFELNNPATSPPEPVDRPLGSPFVGIPVIGTLHFKLRTLTLDIDRTDDDSSAAAMVCSSAPHDCSLRGAIELADNSPGSDTINVPAGTYILTLGELRPGTSMELRGAGADTTIIDADGLSRVIRISGSSNSRIVLSDLWIRGGFISTTGFNPGAGVYGSGSGLVLIERCIISNNQSNNYGGGVFIDGGDVTIINSTIRQNIAGREGGGLRNRGPANVMTVINSVITDNQANENGGGIANAGTLVVENSTIENNVAQIQFGGGIFSAFNPAILTNTTLSGNSAPTGNAILSFQSIITLENTLIDGDCVNVGGFYSSNGGNLESPGDTCGLTNVTDQVNVTNPMLDVLADNGGPTLTMALLAGSPAIDTAVWSLCTATDQRDIDRPQGMECDIGAYEVDAACVDNDLDGYGSPNSSLCTFVTRDCDDIDFAVNPGTTEICNNGIDDNCDGDIDSADAFCQIACEIETDKGVYMDGETVTISTLHYSNPTADVLSTRLRLQLDIAGLQTIDLFDFNNLFLPPGADINLGPFTTLTLNSGFPRGTWAFPCSLADPISGNIQAQDSALFDVQ